MTSYNPYCPPNDVARLTYLSTLFMLRVIATSCPFLYTNVLLLQKHHQTLKIKSQTANPKTH